jgi:class 3 adenylate cyclase
VEAIQAALEIQANVGDLAFEKDARLAVKIGFGVGKVRILQVGGIGGRVEYVPIGNPLSQAFEAEHLAPSGGVIIIPKAVHSLVEDVFETKLIDEAKSTSSPNGPFFYVRRQIANFLISKAAALLLRSSLERNQLLLLKKCVKAYISSSLLPFVDYDLEGWFSNLLEVTTLFASIGVDLGSLNDSNGLKRFNEVICIIQKCIQQTGGSLNKLLMDDKGTTLICIWNGHSHHSAEAASRAISAARQFRRELAKIGVTVSMGIAAGKVFTGVVGASGGRREYSILGDGVNLSARLMQSACKNKDKKIVVDEKTAIAASNRCKCLFSESIMVKGKSAPVNVYHPVDNLEIMNALMDKRLKLPQDVQQLSESLRDPPSSINEHKLPTNTTFTKQISSSLGESSKLLSKNNHIVLVGRVNLEEKFRALVSNAASANKSTVLLISGDSGSGKSHFVRQNLELLEQKEEPLKVYLVYNWVQPHQYFERAASLMNLYTRLMAAARTSASNYTDSEEDILRNLIETVLDSSHQNTKVLQSLPEFVASMSEWKIQDVKYLPKRFTKNTEVFECACYVFEALILCHKYLAQKGSAAGPYVICFDWANLMNEKEIEVIRYLAEHLDIIILLVYTNDFKEKPALVSLSQLEGSFKSEKIGFDHIKLRPLGQKDALVFSNKLASICFEVEVPLDLEMTEYIYEKCLGNPLHMMSLFCDLIQKGYLELSDKTLVTSESFKDRADMSTGERYLVTPPSMTTNSLFLLNQLTPLDTMVIKKLHSDFEYGFLLW